MNMRLSFLRYGPGHYFRPHCDGLVDVSNNGIEQKSFVTLHLYLNEDGLEGGATRFWTPDKKHWLDVHPKMGRVLIFQQRMLVHSGEEVTKGVKYTMRSDFLFEQVAS
jgi:predicted 2-oxoglutarate/Fe(II)-dependent dioxygenase YbiX